MWYIIISYACKSLLFNTMPCILNKAGGYIRLRGPHSDKQKGFSSRGRPSSCPSLREDNTLGLLGFVPSHGPLVKESPVEAYTAMG